MYLCVAQPTRSRDLNLDEIVGELGLLPIELVAIEYDRDDFLEGDYPIGFVTDTDQMLEISQAMQDCGPDIWRNYSIGSLGRDYEGSESYQAAYAMAELNIGPRLTLIPGRAMGRRSVDLRRPALSRNAAQQRSGAAGRARVHNQRARQLVLASDGPLEVPGDRLAPTQVSLH